MTVTIRRNAKKCVSLQTQYLVVMFNRRRLVCAFVFGVLLFPPIALLGQGKAMPSAEKLEQKAVQLYEKGQYREACELLMSTAEAQASRRETRYLHGLTVFFLIDIAGVFFFLYIEKRKAYRLVVEKNTECAQHPVINAAAIRFDGHDCMDNRDQQLLEQLQAMFEVDKVYLDADLTIETLASRLGTNRSNMSKVINQYLGKSLPAILSQYRINEAVRMLTDSKSRQYTIEAVAQMCGYNSRQVFHSAFKKETGLTPTEFRKIAHSKD